MSDPTTPAPTGDPAEQPASEPLSAAQPASEPVVSAPPAYEEVPPTPPAYAAPADYPGQAAAADPASAYGPPPTYAGVAAPPTYGAPSPTGPDPRPKTLGVTAIILSGVGFLLSLGGFIPLLGIFAAGLGGLLLLAGFVLGIVALVSKKQGGTGLGIAAIVLAVVGGILGAVAVAVSSWLFFSTVGSSTHPGAAVSQPAGVYDEDAYLSTVKPQILVVLQTINPDLAADDLATIYPDDQLIDAGQQLATIPEDQRDANRDAFITSSVASSEGTLTEESAGQLFDILITAADQYLVE